MRHEAGFHLITNLFIVFRLFAAASSIVSGRDARDRADSREQARAEANDQHLADEGADFAWWDPHWTHSKNICRNIFFLTIHKYFYVLLGVFVKVGPEIVENWLCCSVSAQRIAFRIIILNFSITITSPQSQSIDQSNWKFSTITQWHSLDILKLTRQ